jgi:hypothetical protein
MRSWYAPQIATNEGWLALPGRRQCKSAWLGSYQLALEVWLHACVNARTAHSTFGVEPSLPTSIILRSTFFLKSRYMSKKTGFEEVAR